ncbi:hypothetical protein BD310DRAFT_1022212, partial [Dichomitus squalens]
NRKLDAVREHDLCPRLVLAISQHKADSDEIDETGQKIDGAFFHAHEAPTDGCPHWDIQLVPVEFKSSKEGSAKDPYLDTEQSGSADAEADTRKESREQITGYAERIFSIQHRHALFMLLVIGRKFRITRWDRAGTVVTTAIDYYEHPDALCEFLWRISHLSDERLGVDPTAVRLDKLDFRYIRMDLAALIRQENEAIHLERNLSPGELEGYHSFRYVREAFAATIASEDYPRFELQVVDAGVTRYFLVGRPVYTASGMAGRGTRGYIAHELATKRFFWLKDSWRVSYENVNPEGLILQQLRAADITNVPTVACHGDVRNQTANLSFRPDCPIREHQHYRVVEEEVCMSLENFKNGRQLVSITLDCLRTHKLASTLPGVQIFHRDITGGNILIYPKIITKKDNTRRLRWVGILSDWEVAKCVATGEERPRPRQPERTCTWQFVSVNLLSNALSRHRLQDELESLLHVLIYYSIRYLHSTLTDGQVASFIDEYFDCFSLLNGKISCGEKKSMIIRDKGELVFSKGYGLTRVLFGSPMDKLIATVLRWFKAHYAVLDYETWRARLPVQLPLPSPMTSDHTARTPPPFTLDKNVPEIEADAEKYEGEIDDDGLYSDDEFPQAPNPNRYTAEVLLKEKDPPTSEDVALAKLLVDHDAMIALFHHVWAAREEWKLAGDKAPDRVDKNYRSPYPIMPDIRAISSKPTLAPQQAAPESKKSEIKRPYPGDYSKAEKTRPRKKSKAR